MPDKSPNSRCKGRTKDGRPCRAFATDGGLCYFHANPNKASELGKIGGRKNRRLLPAQGTDPLPKLRNATDVRNIVTRFIAEVYEGKLPPRIASGLAPLMNLQLRSIEATNFERRLARLEKLLAMGAGKTQETNPDRPVVECQTEQPRGMDYRCVQ